MKKIIAIFLSLICIISIAVPSASAMDFGTKIYVSPGGNDSADGSFENPLATLNGAKNKAKQISGEVTVYFREGTYTLNDTVYFSSDDKADVTYKAYNGENVVFTSSTPYTGFEKCTVNGVTAFRKNVGRDAEISAMFNSTTTLKKTRYPESGYLYPAKIDKKHCLNPEVEETDGGIFMSYCAMYVNKKDLPKLKNPDSVDVRILHWWKDELLPVKSYDSDTGFMEFTKGSAMQINKTDRFFLENVFEALNEPLEWYFDKSEGMLYYIPVDGEDENTLTLWGGKLETLISINGTDGISFENIIFRGNGFKANPYRDSSQAAYDAKACLSCENADNFTVKNCEFKDLSSCAVFMGTAVQNSRVENCIFSNIGAQAVYIRGNNIPVDDPQVTKNIAVTNNIISGYGRVLFNAVAVLVIHANSVDITHNEIHDGYYSAISVGWVWGYAYTVTYNNKICDNLIYNIGQGWLSDMGGIYTLGNQPGTVISGNVIHNVAADPDEGGYGGWGIYLDEGSAYILVEKNLSYCCGNDSYHLHYGSYNTVRNNIFALSGESQVRIVSAAKRCVANDDGSKKTADFTNNILLTDNKVRTFSAMENKDAYYENNNLFWDLTYGDKIFVGKDTDFKKGLSIETAQRKGYIHNPVVADPCFKDAKNYNFELSDNSPAISAGFEKWDISQAGTLKNSVIGINTCGGTTPYNAESAPVEMKSTREPWHIFRTIINWFYNIFQKLFK